MSSLGGERLGIEATLQLMEDEVERTDRDLAELADRA